MALGYDGSIRIDTKMDTRGFNSGIRTMLASVTKLGAALGLVFGVAALMRFGRTAVNEAGQLASALIGLESVVTGTGKSFERAQSFIQDFIADGLVPVTNAVAAYKNLALRGYDTSQIETTLIALKDSAAFGRQASLTLGDAVQTASEGLKNENSILVDNAGVTKNVAKMWLDYAKSIGTSVQSLTKQQKIQAEVNGILEETRFQTGDAAKLTGSYSGQVSALGVSFYNFRVAFGNALIPVLTKVIPLIRTIVDNLTVMMNQFAQFMSVLFGIQQGVQNVAGSTQDAVDSTGDLAEATQDADKAAEGALATFDELNVLQKPKEEGGLAEQISTTPAVDVVPPEVVNPEILAKVQAFKDKLLELLGPAIEAFDRLKESLAPLGQTIWEGLQWAWENILVPFGTWVLNEAFPTFLDLIGSAGGVLNEVLLALKPLGLWLWNEFLKPLADWTGEKIIEALKWLKERLDDIAAWIRDNQKLVETITIIIGAFAIAWLLVTGAVALWTAIGTIAAAVTTAFGVAVAFLTSPIGIVILIIGALIAIIILLVRNWDWVKETAGKVWDWIVEKWNGAGIWFKTHITDPIKKWFTDLWDRVKLLAQDTWSKVVDAWKGAGEWFKTKITDPIKGFFTGLWDGAKNKAAEVWLAVTNIWGAAGAWFTEHVTDPIKNIFGGALDWVADKWQTVFDGVGDFVKSAINALISLLNGMLSAITTGINAVIGVLNNLSIRIPDWVPIFGGQTWGVNLPYVSTPYIPYLASGAVIPPNSQFLAMLGDQTSGRNIEAPEGLIRQILQDELGKMQADIRIEFGGSLGALVRELQPILAREDVRIGKNLISGSRV
jgi:hypothetical protein